jgi:MFS family permease
VSSSLRDRLSGYPRQFWILFFGQLVSAIGMSLVWPFMTIYVREKLDVSLTMVGLVLAANSGAGLVSQVVGGPLVDRFGRKIAMAASLGSRSVIMMSLGLAGDLPSFVALIILSGFCGSLFGPALNAMVADMVEPEKRIEAYGLMRIVSNLGVAIGPAIGGFIATRSYFVSFAAAALASAFYFLIILFFTKETRPTSVMADGDAAQATQGYGRLVRDVPFLAFCITLGVMGIAYAQVMTILPVYIKDQYQIVESQYGLIMATNAAMVVLFQYPVAKLLKRVTLAPALSVGSLFVAVGLGTVAISSTFPMFLLSMIVVTIGELIFAPSSTAFVADVAPETMRGRYMGVYGMSFGLSYGLAPAVGGMINDSLSPLLVWYSMAGVALLTAVSFLLIGKKVGTATLPVEPVASGVAAVGAAESPPPFSGEERCSQVQSPLE